MASEVQYSPQANLLVGNDKKDDAAVFDLGDGKSIISTTDFFTPIVDDPYNFGRIASVNALSDIYAMGGKPIMAVAILGWPLKKLPVDIAQKVIEGARAACFDAGISLAGGHSIDISDPIFGLAVTGQVATEKVKQNSGAKEGNRLFLTKPLGIGIMATAEKQGKIDSLHSQKIIEQMCMLNKVGQELSNFDAVTTMTDVTGFGLLGHLIEICEASDLNAIVEFDKVPTVEGLQKYIDMETFPGGLFKNYKSYKAQTTTLTDMQKYVLCDPQTSGGLLVAVEAENVEEVSAFMKDINHPFYDIGYLIKEENKTTVKVV